MALPWAAIMIAANAAISFGGRAASQAGQKRLTEAQSEFDAEKTKLEAEQQATLLTRSYREQLSYNLALQAMGIGADTAGRQTEATSARNLAEDMNILKQSQRFADIQSNINQALSAGQNFAALAGNVSQTTTEGLSLAKDLELFGSKKGKK